MYPVDPPGLYRWVIYFFVAYIAAAYLMREIRGERYIDAGNEFMLAQLFNGSTFAGSLMILWGVADASIMRIIGDTTMFLVLAGMAGLMYSGRQLFRQRAR